MQKNNLKKILFSTIVIILAIAVFGLLFFAHNLSERTISALQAKADFQDDIESDSQSSFFINKKSDSVAQNQNATNQATSTVPVIHLPTPNPLKGLYMTSWVAGTKTMRDHVIGIVDTTEANAIVVDLKDYSGNISYEVDDPDLKAVGSVQKRIPSLKDLTNLLHSKKIYVIGRIACFQDPYFTKLHPEYAMKTNTDKTMTWTDRKGLSWLDPGEQSVWDYLIQISNDAYAQGVDEIQFDYTRFPSDGDMKNIYYPASEGKDRAEIINDFWVYLHEHLHGTGPVISVDLFGLTATAKDDLGIGQLLENALHNFDYVSPMVYPSHFAANWDSFKDPQSHPYEVVKISMDAAVLRAKAIGVSPVELRPWLQDFGLFGEVYGPKEVRDQITATTDSGLTSWLLWDASNTFSAGGLLPNDTANN